MPEIHIRPIEPSDLPVLVTIDHSYTTEYVWQMDIKIDSSEINIKFRETRLPRSVRLEYPREPITLADDWDQRTCILVAILDDKPVGYISMVTGVAIDTLYVTDLVVSNQQRRRGIGKAMLLAAQDWISHQEYKRMNLVIQSKNFPAISLAQKLGFEFCGYNDKYFTNQDIAVFFSKTLH